MARYLKAVLKLIVFPLVILCISALLVFYTGPLIFSKPRGVCVSDLFETSSPLAPETAVSGIAWGDFNNDGQEDLFVAATDAQSELKSRLYKNVNGLFVDATLESGLPTDFLASSGVFADVNNDGWLDLVVVKITDSGKGLSQNVEIFSNKKGKFVRSRQGYVPDSARSVGKFSTLALGDLDADGRLDILASFFGSLQYISPREFTHTLLVPDKQRGFWTSKYICDLVHIADIFSNEPQLRDYPNAIKMKEDLLEKHGCVYVAAAEAVPGDQRFPTNYSKKYTMWLITPGKFVVLRNTGSKFVDEGDIFPPAYADLTGDSETSPTSPWLYLSHKYHQPVIFDFTDDKKQDIFLAVDGGRNLLLENEGNFNFRDISKENGLEIFGTGMGVAIGDPLRTGKIDHVLVTNVGKAYLFKKKNGNLWLDYNVSLNRNGFGWGVAFFDYNNDGWDDVAMANGTYATSRSSDIFTSTYFEDSYIRDVLYQNNRGSFVETTDKDICADTTNTRALATADVNNDGYEDFAVGTTHISEKKGVTLFLNKGGQNHYLQVKLRGIQSNYAGVGAVITVTAADGTAQSKAVLIGESYNAQNSFVKSFGLGEDGRKVSVSVLWPSGMFQQMSDILPDQIFEIVEAARY